MKLWFDEDLRPTLVQVANARGFTATCNRDRGALGWSDVLLRQVVQHEGYVLVTDNASDFRPMYARDAVHPGLIAVPGSFGRARQQELTGIALDEIARLADAAGEVPDDFMVNTLVVVGEGGAVTVTALPPA